jgi:AraC-like DNA-binding protein
MLDGGGRGVAEAIIPDGRMEIVFHYGARFDRHRPDGTTERQDAAMLVGQQLAPVVLSHDGEAKVAAIRLRPAAGRALVGCAAAEINDRFVDLEAVFGPTSLIREQLALAENDGARVMLLDSWLGAHVRGSSCPALTAAVDAILAGPASADLAAVAADAGISLRQLERRFIVDVGVPPKTFARLARLQTALSRIAAGRALADVALDCGYYDQSHMTRDFMRLGETSPAAWRRQSGVLTPLFINA